LYAAASAGAGEAMLATDAKDAAAPAVTDWESIEKDSVRNIKKFKSFGNIIFTEM
jgi:hypothetical protein